MTQNNLELEQDFKNEILRYVNFWPIFLISILFSLISSYFYLKYTNYQYQSSVKIEIFDKSQDSEMALPTSMTIFNRSMINLDNEIGLLESFSLHEKTVRKLNSNIRYYTIGSIKTTEEFKSDLYEDFNIDFKNTTINGSTSQNFIIKIEDNKLNIISYETDPDISKSYTFPSFSTNVINHDLLRESTIAFALIPIHLVKSSLYK